MELLPGWSQRLARAPAAGAPPAHSAARPPILPLSVAHFAARTTLVATAGAAEEALDLACQRPLSHIGFDTEFRFDRPGVPVGRDRTAPDPSSVRPLALALALAGPAVDGAGAGASSLQLTGFVFDVRRPEVLPALGRLLRVPVPFLGHYTQADLLCLLSLGLPEPRVLWDTWVCEKALQLGRRHRRYRTDRATPGARTRATDADREIDRDRAEAQAREAAEAEEQRRLSLLQTCRRHGLAHRFLEGDKQRLAKSFLDHAADAPFTSEQVDYAAADAEAAAQLYLPQVVAAAQAGLLHHLTTVEMPWTVTNARITWRGVRVDAAAARRVLEACDRHAARLGPQLAEHGVTNPRSFQQLERLFEKLGLLDLFRRGDRVSFDREHLDIYRDRHPSIGLVRAARRVADLRSDQLLTGGFVGTDGRVHPDHRQLGTDTGRQSCRWPNVAGLGKVLRPLVVPEPGRGLGEVDWCQIEMGIAAAVYGDAALVAHFNSGDVYSAMAQAFDRDQLSEADRRLGGEEFKRQHRHRRDRMKTCTLGIIYGLTPHGLARRLGVGVAEATELQDRFLGMFPGLRRGLAEAAEHGAIRGYAQTATGLRRYRARRGRASSWERNWLTNHPVQGTAAAVFKAAGNRLDRLYRPHDAWIVLPLHDAFVFEAPLGALTEVAELTAEVMRQVVREHFPELDARVKVNVEHPECWNKDGRTDSLERWMEDPTFVL